MNRSRILFLCAAALLALPACCFDIYVFTLNSNKK